MEQKRIKTFTITTIIKNIGKIFTFFGKSKILKCFIVEESGLYDNKEILDGYEIAIVQDNSVSIEINNLGDLMISLEELENYEINENGDLIFNEL